MTGIETSIRIAVEITTTLIDDTGRHTEVEQRDYYPTTPLNPHDLQDLHNHLRSIGILEEPPDPDHEPEAYARWQQRNPTPPGPA